jgi:hypothetical protein
MPPTTPAGTPCIAIVWARLKIGADDRGIRPFIVPLNAGRNMHVGVTAKYGYSLLGDYVEFKLIITFAFQATPLPEWESTCQPLFNLLRSCYVATHCHARHIRTSSSLRFYGIHFSDRGGVYCTCYNSCDCFMLVCHYWGSLQPPSYRPWLFPAPFADNELSHSTDTDLCRSGSGTCFARLRNMGR